MNSLDFIPDVAPSPNKKLNTRDKGLASQIADVSQFDIEHSKIPISAVLDQTDQSQPDFIPDTGAPAATAQPEQQGLLSQFGHNLIGGATAIEDIVGSLPGLVGAGTAAGIQALKGTAPQRAFPDVVSEVMQSAAKGNIVDYLAPKASLETARQSPGYEAVNKAMMVPFQGFGNLAAFLADAATKDPEFAADVGSRIEAGTLSVAALSGFAGRAGARPGTLEFYRNLNKEVQSGRLSPEGVGLEQRKTYPPEEPKPDFIPDDMRDMMAQARDEGQFPESITQTQFNIPEETRRQIEAEHDPYAAPEMRIEPQAELFTGYPEGGSLDVIRHGDTALNDANKIRGWEDVPLNDKGKEQAIDLGKQYSDRPVDAVITSDLSRARDTALEISKNTKAPLIESRGLRPWDVGDFTGMDAAEANKVLEQHVKTPAIPVDGGESFNQFKQRFLGEVQRIQQQYAGKNVVIATHHRGERLIKAWEAAGKPADFSVDIPTFLDWQAGIKPGESVSTSIKTNPLPFVPKGQRGAIGDWSARIAKDISKKGLTQTMLEQKQVLSRDNRPMSQLVAEERLDPKNIQDLGGFTRFTGPLIDRTINILAQSRTGAGKIVNWIQSQRERITRERDMKIEEGVQNLLQHWRKLPGGFTDRIAARRQLHTDLREMLATWHDMVGKETLTRDHFKNDRQWQIYQKTHTEIDRNWHETNAARRNAGLPEFQYISNYFPAIWQGDYRIWVKDQAGNNVWSAGVSNKFWGYKVKRDLQKQFPNHIVEDPAHIKTAHEDLPYHDFSASEEGLRLAASNKEAFNALQKAYLKLLYKRGAGAHGLQREGMKGYLGMEGGNKGIANSEKALELWLRRIERHKANLEVNKMQIDLHKNLPREIQAKIPRLMAWADDYLANAGGRGQELSRGIRAIDKAFMEMGKVAQLGESFASRSLSNVTGIASLWKVLTLKFATSQIFQPLNVLAKMRQLNVRMPETSNFLSSFLHGYQGLIWPDKIQTRLWDWAEEQGHLSSAVVEMMKMRQKDLSTAAGNVILDNSRLLLSQEEKYIVRIPTLMAFEHMLRDSIPDEKKRFEAAADHLYYIVNYGHESSPLDYSKGGLLGEAARPMKQYAHNFAGQFLEYVQGAVNYKEFSPLAMFVANQTLLAGLRGTILIAEANAVINLINDKFSTNWPTPENWFLKSGMSDIMLFGLPSYLIGHDISSSVNAPNLPQMFGMFPVKVASDAATKVSHYFYQLSQGRATQNDQMDALIAVTPNQMHGWIEEYYSRPGMPVPHPGKMNMQGTYIRTETDKKWAEIASLKSLPEARKDAEMRTFKQMFLNDSKQKLEAIDVIADRVMTHQPITPDVLQQFVREGGDPNTLVDNLKNRIMGRALPFNQRQVIGPEMTFEKMHKLQIMKDALDRQVEQGQEAKESGVLPMSMTATQRRHRMAQRSDAEGSNLTVQQYEAIMSQYPKGMDRFSRGPQLRGQLGAIPGIGGLPEMQQAPTPETVEPFSRGLLAPRKTTRM